MTKRAEKLLIKMRRSNKNWKRRQVETLYFGFGFIIDTKKGKHDKVFHPKYPQLVTGLPRHREIGEWVIEDAVEMVDNYIELERKEQQNE